MTEAITPYLISAKDIVIAGWNYVASSWLGHQVAAGINWALSTKVGIVAAKVATDGWALAVAHPYVAVPAAVVLAALAGYAAYRIFCACCCCCCRRAEEDHMERGRGIHPHVAGQPVRLV